MSAGDNTADKGLIEETYQTEVTETDDGHLSFRVSNGSELLVDFIK
ncbi:hypothetical protein RZN22_01815 [Bacillaceae bacterium S4-13-58]